MDWSQIDARIKAERERRLELKARGEPMHYWRERGDREPPCDEFWCDHCAGYYGVPHDFQTHEKGHLCRNIHSATDSRPHRCRQCACIDCVVAEQMTKETT
jgi:hypothetical protein